jgi:outer membrane protein assembly factor BamA
VLHARRRRRPHATGLGVAAALIALVTAGAARAAASPPSPAPPAPSTVEARPPRAWDIAALPIVNYQPETSLGIGAQAMLVRTASTGSPEEERHDTLALSVFATMRHQYGFGFTDQQYWNQDRDRVRLDLVAQRFPNTFWGLGNDTPAAAAAGYTPQFGGGQLSYAHRLVEKVFAGATVAVGYYRIQGFAPDGAVADFLATRRTQGWLVGVGPTLARDSRDDSNFPRAGSTTSLGLTAYRSAWLSDYQFIELDADHRMFFGLPRRSVLALQAFAQGVIGEPPIELLPALGGPERLRGYFMGRYRDKGYAMAQVEWRVPLFWRLGGAVFAAAGDVFPDLDHLGDLRIKSAGGLGLRLNVGQTQPLNIRLDAAAAPGTSVSIYLNIGEAI